MRRIVATLTIGLIALVSEACSPEEYNAAEQVERFRVTNGLAQLEWDETLYAKARAWSEQMATDGELYHSQLSAGAPDDWAVLGENVAWNTSLDGALRALEASPSHRANLLNPAFTRFAVGVVHQGDRYWVTQVFLGT